ncbi:SMI1/KNR4 family protein [Capnocytophaga stomatis]|uniref:SMI1/KNR4 family protein n=1 Tax=Capnocytophaga stomatis TaxID=1848904 RepID=A0A250FTR9_9FLAO|nr:SMI1/KNR4 family protein [Capnocytophaga stomatis]ATA88503.1 SMI1/KNR4 family protein [Capnocytophaga stomatis]GIM50350.1 hypothetical protein CAPN003_18020 [Capnocytophaga stomatis]
MKIQTIEKGIRESYKIVEEQFGIELPKDYRNFLDLYNGAVIDNGYFYVEDLDEYITMHSFYGVNTDVRSHNIIFKNEEFIDDIPEKSILIGRDQGGGWLLLINDGENDGIWYYDHSYFFEQSSDEENTYFICETFTEFLEMLENTKLPEG